MMGLKEIPVFVRYRENDETLPDFLKEKLGIKRDGVLGENQQLFENEDGFVIYRKNSYKDTCEIDYIKIDKATKNKGYGEKLLRSFVDTMKSEKVLEFYLDAIVVDEGVYSLDNLVKFYSKVGFTAIDRFKDDETERVIMGLDLSLDVTLEKREIGVYEMFKNSIVCDDNGLLTVYHGTNDEWDEFKAKEATWFTESKSIAESFGENVKEVVFDVEQIAYSSNRCVLSVDEAREEIEDAIKRDEREGGSKAVLK